MLNLMEDERKKEISQDQMYQAEASEKPVENVYKPRALIFERQPTRYAWFVLDSSDDLKQSDGIWEKTNKLSIPQNLFGTRKASGVPIKTFKTSHNTNSLPWNKRTEYNGKISETNITCAKQRTRKRSIQITNDNGLRHRNKRLYLKEENSGTQVNTANDSRYQDKNEVMKDEVTPCQAGKTTAEESLKLEDTMDHKKSPPLTETQNYLEHNDIKNTVRPAEQYSEAHAIGTKSSDSCDKSTENKHGISKQDAMKLCTNPEPVEMNNLFMNVADTSLDKSEKTVGPQIQYLETNKEKGNRIFGRTPDNLNHVNTEAVKFSFGSSTTDTPYKEAIVFSARDRHRNQNDPFTLKQNTLKLRKPEEATHRNSNDVNKCNERMQTVGESMLNEYLTQEKKDDLQIKQNSGTEIFSQGIRPPRKDKYQSEVTIDLLSEKEQKGDSENQKISDENDITTLSTNSDTNADNTEIICKTCLALQAAEKCNYKNFSVVIDSLTEVKQEPSNGHSVTEVKQKTSKSDLGNNEKQDADKTTSQNFSDETVCVKTEPHKFTDFEHQIDVQNTASHELADEIASGKPEAHHFTNNKYRINDDSEIKKSVSSTQKKDFAARKTEKLLIDAIIVSTSTDKNVAVEHTESGALLNKLSVMDDSIQSKSSASSENSQVIERDSQVSAESLVTDKQTKVKKHRNGWFSRLFGRLHKRKSKKVVECDIVSTPSKSCP